MPIKCECTHRIKSIRHKCVTQSDFFRIHPRYKQDIAERLFLAARNVAYGEKDIKSQGPFPTGIRLDSSTNQLIVEYDNGTADLQVNTNSGFEVRIRV